MDSGSPNGAWAHVRVQKWGSHQGAGPQRARYNWKELPRGELSGWEMDGDEYQDAKEPLVLPPAGPAPAPRIRAPDWILMRERQGQWGAEEARPGARVSTHLHQSPAWTQ